MTAKIRGLSNVLKNLNKEIRNIEGRTREGMQAVGAFVKAESVERTPVEFGVLRNSAFYSTDETPKGPVVRVGYTAEYAPYVHEAPMKLKGVPRTPRKGVYWQGGENKFLQKAVSENTREIVRIIANRAKIDGR